MNLFKHKYDCTGCTACYHACHQKAITMEYDEEGFLFPVINFLLCINCGLCKLSCPFNNKFIKQNNYPTPLFFAAKHKDDDIRLNSSSGGIFTALSDSILRDNGIVYGAVFDHNLKVLHNRAENINQRNLMRGSKYLQSDLKEIFFSVKRDLLNNKKVLFTGTPCQTSGLYYFLRNIDTSNLLLCDFVCNGVISPLVWSIFIEYLNKKYKQKVDRFFFRHKTLTSKRSFFCAFLNDSSTVSSSDLEIINRIYFGHWATRQSCFNCHFSNIHRPSDITIADFWGLENQHPQFYDTKGVSLILINSSKGFNIFEEIKPDINFIESSRSKCLQPNLESPPIAASKRDYFMNDIFNKPFKKVVTHYNIIDSDFYKLIKLLISEFRKIILKVNF